MERTGQDRIRLLTAGSILTLRHDCRIFLLLKPCAGAGSRSSPSPRTGYGYAARRQERTEWSGYKVHLTETIHTALGQAGLLAGEHFADEGHVNAKLLATSAGSHGVDPNRRLAGRDSTGQHPHLPLQPPEVRLVLQP